MAAVRAIRFDAGVLAMASTVEAAGSTGDAWRAAGSLRLRGRLADAEVYEPRAEPHPAL
jgi:class 3 adenylate cyclase